MLVKTNWIWYSEYSVATSLFAACQIRVKYTHNFGWFKFFRLTNPKSSWTGRWILHRENCIFQEMNERMMRSRRSEKDVDRGQSFAFHLLIVDCFYVQRRVSRDGRDRTPGELDMTTHSEKLSVKWEIEFHPMDDNGQFWSCSIWTLTRAQPISLIVFRFCNWTAPSRLTRQCLFMQSTLYRSRIDRRRGRNLFLSTPKKNEKQRKMSRTSCYIHSVDVCKVFVKAFRSRVMELQAPEGSVDGGKNTARKGLQRFSSFISPFFILQIIISLSILSAFLCCKRNYVRWIVDLKALAESSAKGGKKLNEIESKSKVKRE